MKHVVCFIYKEKYILTSIWWTLRNEKLEIVWRQTKIEILAYNMIQFVNIGIWRLCIFIQKRTNNVIGINSPLL